MRLIFLFFVLVIGIFSCKKGDDVPAFSEASYEVTLQGQWKLPQFTVPGGVHFTSFVGMVHNNNTLLWRAGQLASSGVEMVAEDGNPAVLLAQVNSEVINKTALTPINIPPPAATGNMMGTFLCNTDYSYISLVSMIAPSPDWFVGISALNLYTNKKWVADTLINLYVYDAGTEAGDVFGLNNPESIPRENIQLLIPSKATVLANGNATLAPIATIRFKKQ